MPIGFYDQSQVGQTLSPNQEIYARVMGLVPPPAPSEASLGAIPSQVAETPLDPVEYQRLSLLGGQQGSWGPTRDMLMREQAGLQAPKLESGVPTQHMLGKALVIGLLERLLGGKKSKGRIAAGLLGGLTQGAQMGAETRNRNAMMEFQRQNELLGTEAKIAGLNAADAKDLRREKLGEIRYQQERADKISESKAEIASREKIAGMRVDSDVVKGARKTLNDPKSTKASRAAAIIDLEAEGIVYPPDLKQQYLESTYYEDNVKAKTAGVQAKTETENAMRPGRLKKLDADVARVIQSAAKDSVQAELIKKKVDMYDDEFKLRAANIQSQILKRAQAPAGGGGGAPSTVNQERLILNSIISLNKAQLKQIPATPSNLLRIATLTREIEQATNRLKEMGATLKGEIAPFNPVPGGNLQGEIGVVRSGQPAPPPSKAFPWKPRKPQ